MWILISTCKQGRDQFTHHDSWIIIFTLFCWRACTVQLIRTACPDFWCDRFIVARTAINTFINQLFVVLFGLYWFHCETLYLILNICKVHCNSLYPLNSQCVIKPTGNENHLTTRSVFVIKGFYCILFLKVLSYDTIFH